MEMKEILHLGGLRKLLRIIYSTCTYNTTMIQYIKNFLVMWAAMSHVMVVICNMFDVVFNHCHLFFTTTTHISTTPIFWPVWVITTTFFCYHHVANKAQVELMAVCKFSFFLFSPLSSSATNQIYFRCFSTLRHMNTTTTAHLLSPPFVFHHHHQFSSTSSIFWPPLVVFDHCCLFLDHTISIHHHHPFFNHHLQFWPLLPVFGLSITVY